MRKNLLFATCILAALISVTSRTACADDSPKRIYVSPAGNDSWFGNIPEADGAKSNGPFATIERAREKARTIKGAWVILRGGTYTLDKPLEFGPEDSGTYMAYPGEEVRITGGKEVKDFAFVSDPAVLARLDENARKNVMQADLKACGVTEYGNADGGGAEVFFGDMPMSLCRWPNEGFVRIVDVVEQDGHEIHGVKGSKVGKFIYDGDRPKRWVGEQDPWLHGYWFWDWSDQRQPLASIDVEKSIMSLAGAPHGYGYRKGQWYYAFNMLSELDAPGEWYIDRQNGILYFWPPEPIHTAKTVVSVAQTLISAKNASSLVFRGFTFEAARGTAITVEGGAGVRVVNSVIRNSGGTGATLSGKDHSVEECDIYRVGGAGISLTGGDRPTLTPGNLRALNNDIHEYGRIRRMYSAGIHLNGVGNAAANNHIHDAPHIGIMFGGNEHVMEYNEINNVCMESNDAGAIYAGRDWTMRGNKVQFNYLHHITGFEGKGCVGVYLDDMFASADITSNVFYKVTRAAFIGGGRDCTVENNIFVDCDPALHVDARALNWAHYHADEWIAEAKEKGTISTIAYNKPPYSERYPKLVTILDDNPKAPVGNLIARNICVGGKWDDIEEIGRPFLKFEDNIIDEDPLFVDQEKQDFRLRNDSPAFRKGFKAIPIEKIGLRRSRSCAITEAVSALRETTCEQRVTLWINHEAACRGCAVNGLEKALKKRKCVSNKNVLLGRMALAYKYREAGDSAAARKEFKRVVAMKDAPQPYPSLAQLQIIRSLIGDKDYDGAERACGDLMAMENIPPHHKWEAEEQLRSIDRLKVGLSARDPESSRTKLPPVPASILTVYVAPSGDDASTGAPDKPLATLARALAVVSDLNRQNALPKGGVRVELAAGTYPVEKGIVADASISGREDAPVVIASKGDACLTGGRQISGFTPVADGAILNRLPDEARGKVYVSDLKAQGITDYGEMTARGFTFAAKSSLELFCDGQPLKPARWPNEGFVHTGKVDDPGVFSNRGGVFEFKEDRALRWGKAEDIWLYGYWFYDWADNTIGVSSLDMQNRRIHTAHTSPYGIKEGQSYYAFNLLEEIDQPGEWYLDRKTGLLYVYPPADPASAKYEISLCHEPMLKMEGAKHVVIEGLNLDLSAGDGILITDGEYSRVVGCKITRLGGSGVQIKGGHDCGILSCDISMLGRGGTTIIGGDRKTLAPGNHFVENCHIYNFSRIDKTYTPAVQIEGVGNRIAHNLFNDTSCHAIRLEGNNHLVELNDVHDVVRESDDQGGIDIFYNPSYRGNIIRYNYWHDIGNGRGCGMAGIRLDDAISGTLMYGNVFYRCSESLFGGIQIHGGKDNWVENNLFLNCRNAVSFSAWGKVRWNNFLDGDAVQRLLTKAVNINEPPYTTQYPELANLREGYDINRVWRNVAWRCGGFLTRDQGKQNVADNYITREDPGFEDAAKLNFKLKDTAEVFNRTSLSPIPFDEIGLYADPYRARLEKK